MSDRKARNAAMKERLRQFSQGSGDTSGPLPGIATTEEPLAVSPPPPAAPLVRVALHEKAPVPGPPQQARGWRSQGVTVYGIDDERLERLARFFKMHGVRFGRRGQISLLAGAGIAALEKLIMTDPTALLAIVQATMREREGQSAAPRGTLAS